MSLKVEKLITEDEIKEKIIELSNNIAQKCISRNLNIISLLNGSFIFTADLVRELSKRNILCNIFFIQAKSYSNFNSTGSLSIKSSLNFIDNFSKNDEILLIDDIFDTGLTLIEISKILEKKELNFKTCVFLIKKKDRKYELKIDFPGFFIEDKFVVGYGLDYNNSYRELPFVGILK